ncbi:hypothetical protein GIB67_010139 [Kingdonia uniflora]|uniref:Uncharacterized protein n=1 Tax=Kingdonia uniflora TaxID=39325 RepID=A0A7J7NA73_9MAGN|nr:hypothetical protein GIB67_010139 [Kingdonia uniflora]
MIQFQQQTLVNQNSTSQSISNLKTQIEQLANVLHERPPGTLPSQPVSNPKGPPGFDSSSIPKQVNVITTLRSGRQIDNQIEMPKVEPTPIAIEDEDLTMSLEEEEYD